MKSSQILIVLAGTFALFASNLDASSYAQVTSSDPATTQVARYPQPDEQFPPSVTFLGSSPGVLVPDSELPIGKWKVISFELFEGNGKLKTVMKATFQQRPPVIVNFQRHQVLAGVTPLFGPWYKLTNGCLRQYWPYPTNSLAMAGPPVGEFINSQIKQACRFVIKGRQLKVFVGGGAPDLPDGVVILERFKK
jgi:hypothetical protein